MDLQIYYLVDSACFIQSLQTLAWHLLCIAFSKNSKNYTCNDLEILTLSTDMTHITWEAHLYVKYWFSKKKLLMFPLDLV